MPRLLPLRRRTQPDRPDEQPVSGPAPDEGGPLNGAATSFEPFVPVPRQRPAYEADSEPEPQPEAPRVQEPPTGPPASGVRVQLDVLLVALGLIAGGVFGTLLKLDRVRNPDVETWWPAAILGVAVLWMLIALIRRQVAAFLGGAALAGVGLSLLMDTQDIAAAEKTLLGMVLVTVGLGIVIRGFLIRQRTPV